MHPTSSSATTHGTHTAPTVSALGRRSTHFWLRTRQSPTRRRRTRRASPRTRSSEHTLMQNRRTRCSTGHCEAPFNTSRERPDQTWTGSITPRTDDRPDHRRHEVHGAHPRVPSNYTQQGATLHDPARGDAEHPDGLLRRSDCQQHGGEVADWILHLHERRPDRVEVMVPVLHVTQHWRCGDLRSFNDLRRARSTTCATSSRSSGHRSWLQLRY